MNSQMPQSRRKLILSKTNVVLLVITIASAVSAWWITYDMNDPDGFKMSEFWVAALLNVALGLFVWWITDGLRAMISRSVQASTQLAGLLGALTTTVQTLTNTVKVLEERLYGPATESQPEVPQGDINVLREAVRQLHNDLANVCPWTKPIEEDKVDAHAHATQVISLGHDVDSLNEALSHLDIPDFRRDSWTAFLEKLFANSDSEDSLRTQWAKVQEPQKKAADMLGEVFKRGMRLRGIAEDSFEQERVWIEIRGQIEEQKAGTNRQKNLNSAAFTTFLYVQNLSDEKHRPNEYTRDEWLSFNDVERWNALDLIYKWYLFNHWKAQLPELDSTSVL